MTARGLVREGRRGQEASELGGHKEGRMGLRRERVPAPQTNRTWEVAALEQGAPHTWHRVGPLAPWAGGCVVSQLSPLADPPQAAKIITYKEPDNPEYLEFLQQLKHLAQKQFNFSLEDGLVGGVRGPSSTDASSCWCPACSLGHLRIPRPPLPFPPLPPSPDNWRDTDKLSSLWKSGPHQRPAACEPGPRQRPVCRRLTNSQVSVRRAVAPSPSPAAPAPLAPPAPPSAPRAPAPPTPLPLQVNTIPASFHDGLLLYVQAVRETLARGGSFNDGEAVTQRMWNRSFQGQGLEAAGRVQLGAPRAGGHGKPLACGSGVTYPRQPFPLL